MLEYASIGFRPSDIQAQLPLGSKAPRYRCLGSVFKIRSHGLADIPNRRAYLHADGKSEFVQLGVLTSSPNERVRPRPPAAEWGQPESTYQTQITFFKGSAKILHMASLVF